MNILLATPLYPPDSGGPAMEAALLVAELPKKGIKVDVYSFGSVRHLPRVIRHFKYFLGLVRRARHSTYIVAIDTFSVCVPAALASLVTGTPLVVRVPGEYAWEQGVQRFGITDDVETFQTKRYGWKVEAIRTIQYWAIKRAVLLVTCSDFLKKIVLQWGVDTRKLMYVYLGIDLNEPYQLPKKPEGKIIFSLGRFVPWKGFGMLVDLLKELPEEWKLVIVGDGPLRKNYQQEASDLGVAHRIQFPGILPRAEVLGWYRAADVFVLNSQQENFSFQLLEAMAAGAAIVATSIGALPELVTDGVEGVLCTPNDKSQFRKAIESIETQPELWRARRAAALKKSKLFSAELSADAFAAALRNIR